MRYINLHFTYLIIIIIQYLYSALKSCKGYRGAYLLTAHFYRATPTRRMCIARYALWLVSSGYGVGLATVPSSIPGRRGYSTGMGDCLRAAKPSRYFTEPSRPTQPPGLSGTGNEYRPTLCGWRVKAGWLIPYVDKHRGGRKTVIPR